MLGDEYIDRDQHGTHDIERMDQPIDVAAIVEPVPLIVWIGLRCHERVSG
jgi:hypothetical protein